MMHPIAQAAASRAAVDTLLAHLPEWLPYEQRRTPTNGFLLFISHPVSGVRFAVEINTITGGVVTRRGEKPNFKNVVELFRFLYGPRATEWTDDETFAAIRCRFGGK